MIRHKEIWSASLKYTDEHPSDYTNEMYDIVDIEKAFKAGAEWADKTAWKPSDKQMEALANALSLAKNCGIESAFDLRTLYEQLKKLKGE
jgi:hypothetical protein